MAGNVAAMAAQAWFSQDQVDVAPGTTVVLQMTVVNLADTTDAFVLTPSGLAAAWTTIEPATLTLFGGTQQVVAVEVRPPMLPSTTAGPTLLPVRIVPHSDPDDVRGAETTIVIGSSQSRRLDVLQPAQRGRRGATFEMMLENRGNTPASCRLRVIDPSGRVEGEFDPPAAGVEPGASTLIRLKLRTKGMQWERRARTLPFRIDADQTGSPTATAEATFVQVPIVPERMVGRLVAAAGALALIAACWFTVVKPAIRDAADEAVKDAQPTAATTPNTNPDNTGQTNQTVASTLVPIVNDGQPTAIPFSPIAAQGETIEQRYSVPAGQVLQVTDLIVQNPNADQGTLTIQRNEVVLFTYRLDNIFSDVGVPLVTPIEFLTGQDLVVVVSCVGVGDQTVGTCAPKVTASGVLLTG
ncbi:MAG: hypothetical protein K8R99_02305 [Actinomycetia bacterium]|nr:hypothetical protein [Actinomycetes bacterium]